MSYTGDSAEFDPYSGVIGHPRAEELRMDPLVLAAGTAVVTAMATDGWEQARAAVVALWRRVHPDQVPAVESELRDVRAEVLAAREAGDRSAEVGLAGDWQRRLRRLLAADPRAGDELRRVLDEELAPLLNPAERSVVHDIEMTATASGHGRVYQAGRDQHISEG
jgi:hypothetical protein